MKYIGNFKEWIRSEWMEEMTVNPGLPMCLKDFKNLSPGERESCLEAGYVTDQIFHWKYKEDNVSFIISETPPWLPADSEWNWWIVKMFPGQLIPLHRDFPPEFKAERFYVALGDYKLGHIMFENNKLLTDYQLGDVYQFDGSGYHGSANIGHSIRVSMQVVRYLPKII
jgi:hypothetical protein